MKLYIKVKHLLEEFPELRDSDKKLVWKIWKDEGDIETSQFGEDCITYDSFFKATGHDNITRARRMVQADCPELRGNKWVQKQRKLKETAKGTHVYHEDYKPTLF